ncbi:MAG: nuclear transport factor 2 family protein [Myxococcales bacterium]|nr:nuclear transport factor 2 family protein [Myxococcales bacterium]
MSEKNIQTAQAIYAAFGRGDLPGVLEHIHEELRHFGVVAANADAPWQKQISKKADVPRFFQALAENLEFTRFEPGAFAASADHVYCTVTWDATIKKNGKKMTQTVFHRFTFKQGRVVEWQGTEDTAKTKTVL